MTSYNHTQYSQLTNSPDNVYYDLTARSYASNEREVPIPIKLSDTRSTPIISDISMYDMSIVRFELDTFAETLPVFFFQTERYSTDRDLGIYKVAMEYDNGLGDVGFAESNLIWKPQIQGATPPVPPSENPSGIQSNSEYYWAYTFTHIIDLINDALTSCFNKLQVSLVPTLDNDTPPFMTWEKDQTARLYADKERYDIDVYPNAELGVIRLYFNKSLYSILSSFPSLKVTQIGTTSNFNYYQIMIRAYKGTKVLVIPESETTNGYIYVDQEYSTVDQFSPVASIIFTSALIPVIPNAQSNPQIWIDGQPLQLTSSYNQFSNIITDISASDLCGKPSLLYLPSAEYRVISLQNNKQPLNQLDFEVFWVDKTGVSRSLLMAQNSSVSLKLLFRKKKYIP